MKIVFFMFAILILSIFSILPLLRDGFFEFHDNTQVVRVYEMGKMLTHNVFPVRWVPDLGYGYGYPLFNFYAPLPYYVGGVFQLIGFDSLLSTKIMIGIGMLLSGITMFFFARKFFGTTGGLLSAILYIYFPYHAVNLYIRGAVGELFAYAFLPLLFLGIFSLFDVKKFYPRHLVPFLIFTFGVFLIAISHNLTFLMMILMLIPSLIVGIVVARSKSLFILVFVSAFIIGVLLSAFFTLPAYFEMRYTNVASQVGGGADFQDHFVCIGQFWNSGWGFGGSIPGCMDGMSFKLGKANILLMAVSIFLLVYSLYKKKLRVQEKVMITGNTLLLISFFLTLQVSSFIWENVPFMEYIQYPWRFINFISLFISFMAGYIVFSIRKIINKKILYALVGVLVIGIIAMNFKLFMPQRYNDYNSSYYTDQEYINFTVSKISDEYMPKGFQKPENKNDLPKELARLKDGNGELFVARNEPIHLKLQYKVSNADEIHINKAYFPSWKSYINGVPASLTPQNNGMVVNIGKGEGTLELKFENTQSQNIANIISFFAFFGLLIGIIVNSIRRNNYAK